MADEWGGALHDKTPEKKVRVIDRRSFTADGELKATTDAPPPAPAPPERQDNPPLPREPEPAAPRRAGGPGFLDLVEFFAQQTVFLLSGHGQGGSGDREAARYLIDLLAVVEEKTRGQLSPEEQRAIHDVLYQLRTMFVTAAR